MNKQKIIRHLFTLVLAGIFSITGTVSALSQTGSGDNGDSPYVGTGTGIVDNPYMGTGTGDNGTGEGGRSVRSSVTASNPANNPSFFQNLINSFWRFIA